jgi:hypothetical protein
MLSKKSKQRQHYCLLTAGAWLTLQICKWRQYVPPEHVNFYQTGVTSQKIVFFIVNTDRTSNPEKVLDGLNFLTVLYELEN